MGANVQTQAQEYPKDEAASLPKSVSIRLPTLDDLKGLEEIQQIVFGHHMRVQTIETTPPIESRNIEQPNCDLNQNINRIPVTIKSYIDDDLSKKPSKIIIKELQPDPQKLNQEQVHHSNINQQIPENQQQNPLSNINQDDFTQSNGSKKPIVAIRYIDNNNNIVSEQPFGQEKASYIEVSQQKSHFQQHEGNVSKISDQVPLSQSNYQAYKVYDSSAIQLQQ